MRKKIAAVLAVLVLAGVGLTVWLVTRGDDRPPAPTFPAAPALWNPCDALTSASVSRMYDTKLLLTEGSPEVPECRLTPDVAGGVAIDANYSLVPGTLDELIATFGTSTSSQVLTPKVPAADDARIIVHVSKNVASVSGFVKNGNLVQAVNAVQPKPASRSQLVAATTKLLSALAAHAEDSGITGS